MNTEREIKYTCAVVPCRDYSERETGSALTRALASIEGLDFVRPGMKIVIKANLVAAMKPEAAATTHPALVTALVKMLTERGAKVVVGDSPGGLFTVAALNGVYRATGMTETEAAGAELNRNIGYHKHVINGNTMKELTYTDYLDDCDAIIDFAKLKAHGMIGMSAAVKNLYGVIPGLLKPETHYVYPDPEDFADMLIDINEYFRPKLRLALIDAVVGMEGNGPTAGTPKEIGALIAARTTYEADAAAARLIGLKTEDVPTLAAAKRRGLCPDGISLYGDPDSLAVKDFESVPRRSITSFGSTRGKFIKRFVDRTLSHKPAPIKMKCVACKKCMDLCPAKAITMVKRGKYTFPKIDRSKCIKCFCCQEFCPKGAMIVKRNPLMKLLQR